MRNTSNKIIYSHINKLSFRYNNVTRYINLTAKHMTYNKAHT